MTPTDYIVLENQSKSYSTEVKADDARKLYYNAHQHFINYELAKGDLMYHHQRRLEKLLPRAEAL